MAAEVTVPPAQAPSLARNRGFVILIAGQFVSRTGDALLSLASIWLVLELTNNSPLATSVTLAAQTLPVLLFGLVTGVLVDRWDRRLTMAAADTVRGLLVLAVPLLHAAGMLAVWQIVALLFALTSLERLFTPARQALLPDLVASHQVVRANAIAEGSSQAAWIVGPALAGVLVGVIGAANVFYIDATTFFVSTVSLLLIRVRRARATPRGSLWQEALGGLRHLRATPVLARAISLATAGNIAFAAVPALLPVLARGTLGVGARVYGAMMASFFVGSVVGSALIGRLGERVHRGRTLLISIALVGVMTLAIAVAPTAFAAAVALFVLGAAASAFNVALYSLLQQGTPAELRGRVFAVMQMASQSARPLAWLVAGLIATQTNVRIGIGALAVAAVAAGLLGATSRSLRSLRSLQS